ncbi:MAG: hypothetical protein IJU23_03260 [Proteobacteria bacterium]|nr:hypothetical protein [Pseudomonadota bacterium]
MNNHQILLACRDNAEAEIIRTALQNNSPNVFHRAGQLFEQYLVCPESFIIMTSLIIDETALGLLSKAAIIHPGYFVVYAHHANKALNVLRLFGCGCAAILGPDELPTITSFLSPSKSYLDELVMPPFFIDDEESALKDPSVRHANPLHVTFLGTQAIMSCANAILNINASKSMSMACVGPSNTWAREHLSSSIREYTKWQPESRPVVTNGTISFCNDFDTLSSLAVHSQHIVILHGHISDEEAGYISSLPPETRIFVASNEGYSEKIHGSLGVAILPNQLWDVLISSLYES